MENSLMSQRIGRSIQEMRKSRGMTKVELAERIGITRQKLSEIEQGSSTVAMSYYDRALNALGGEVRIIAKSLPTLDELEDVFR
ncbi:helix-turn-helix transcriptional regulator [Pseudomonas aegrilactucae]|uniref:Helix-turn-helix transcriptional regulator n=1 Tax=Pseudomonas aegrilactucae TaxID=2854028 RepID=A0A9Q3AFQ8_9PSED|nr:helix-turn-helix transcriptional regulator [Pseudomonas aegrilactucae]MBV6289830.1 helix-turn-helix transcriptional regulator [Pseudomonas aegrilactucae]